MSTRDEINVRVLQQQDRNIIHILAQTTFVVLYKYSLAESSWSKLPFEGTLFVFERNDGSCGYSILNRLSLDNFTKTLLSEEDVMETEGYVIHKVGEDIWGLWIWDEPYRSDVFRAMKSAAQRTQMTISAAQNGCGQIHLGALFEGKAIIQS